MKIEQKIELWMDRFHGRRDVFGQIFTRIVPGKKKPKKSVAPVYIPKYRDKKTREGKEFSGPEELYEPLTPDRVQAHIEGRMEVMVYLPRRDGTTNFFAVDFDFQHGFEEVQRVSKALSHHNIPHGIARSTTKGHHIYVFFDSPIQSFYITNFMKLIYTDLGYMEKLKNGEVVGQDDMGKDIKWSNPELFPKVISISGPTNTGNGVKPAMYGKAMKNDQCCFVNSDDKVIGGSGTSEEQWSHFKSIPDMSSAAFIKLIEDLEIEVDDDLRLSEKRGAVKDHGRKRSVPYEKPDDGDFMLVINGCPALRRMWESPVKDMPHMGRVALLSMALKCKNGLDIIREKFGDSPIVNKQINWAMETSQNPWCCKTMQDYDICLRGKDPTKATGKSTSKTGEIETDYCFEKTPPIERINGRIKVNPKNLPEEEWPWPSPIRNRIPFQKKGTAAVTKEIDTLSSEDPKLESKLESICRRIVSLRDKKAQKTAEDYLKDKGLTSKKNIDHFIKVAKEQKKEDAERKLDSIDGFRVSNDIRYARIDGAGYAIVRMNAEGEDTTMTISNFEIEFDLDRTNHPVVGNPVRYFEGRIICNGKNYAFRISSEDYASNSKLGAVIYSSVGPEADFKPSNLDYVRAAASLFGREKMKLINSYEDYGFDSNKVPKVYRSTTGNITENGMSYEDDEVVVDLTDAVFARYLGLEDIEKTEFANLVDVLKKNILSMQDYSLTITTVAHAMQAVIHNVWIPFNESPILWLQGLTGVGKSKLGQVAQQFHGNFPKVMTIQSTQRSIDQYAMVFKDALLVLDDYKKSYTPEKVIVPMIQKIYDRSERGRLTSDLKQSNTINCRGLVMFTAEDAPTAEASVIARLIYIESTQKLKGTLQEKDNLREIEKVWDKLSGITGKFIQYMLSVYPEPAKVHDRFHEVNTMLSQGVFSKQNAPRIVNNLSANFLTWEIFLEFLVHESMMTEQELKDLSKIHLDNIKAIRDDMILKCQEEQASNVFLSVLKQLVSAGEYRVDGAGPVTHAKSVGFFVNKDTEAVPIVYLYPDMAYKAVKKALGEGDNNLSHSKESIGKQLLHDGFLAKTEKNSTRYKKTYKGSRSTTWALNAKKAGFLTMLDDNNDEHNNDENVVQLKSLPIEDL